MSLDQLAQEIGGPLSLIAGMGGSLMEPTGFVLMNVKVACVQGYDEGQVALVMDDPGMTECPVILGTSTLYQVMEVIKENEISKLAVPWSSSQILWLMQYVTARLSQVVVNDVANKLQNTFSTNWAECFLPIVQNAFCQFSYLVVSETCAGLGEGVVRGCASRSLLGSYVCQESI